MASADSGYDHFRYPSSLVGRNCGDEVDRDGSHSPPVNMAHFSSRKMAGGDGMTGGSTQGGMIRGEYRCNAHQYLGEVELGLQDGIR